MLTEQYRPTYYRIRPQNSLGCRPLAPQTIIPWYLVGMPVGLTSLLGQVSGGGGRSAPPQISREIIRVFPPLLVSHYR